jgi:hypothetical protein
MSIMKFLRCISPAGRILKKLKSKFLAPLHEGQQKAYRIPLKDRPPQTLNFGKQTYSDSNPQTIYNSANSPLSFSDFLREPL